MKFARHQIDHFGRQNDDRFFEIFRDHLRSVWPAIYELLAEDRSVRAYFDDVMGQGRSVGLKRRNQFVKFSDLICATDGGVELDSDDEQYEWARMVLGDLIEPADQRLDVVWTRVKSDLRYRSTHSLFAVA